MDTITETTDLKKPNKAERALKFLIAARERQDKRFRKDMTEEFDMSSSEIMANLTTNDYADIHEQFFLVATKNEKDKHKSHAIIRMSDRRKGASYNIRKLGEIYDQVYSKLLSKQSFSDFSKLKEIFNKDELYDFIPYFERFMQAYIEAKKYLVIS